MLCIVYARTEWERLEEQDSGSPQRTGSARLQTAHCESEIIRLSWSLECDAYHAPMFVRFWCAMFFYLCACSFVYVILSRRG